MALALFRAPYILALGMVAQLTTRVTALVVDGRFAVLSMMRRRLRVATAVVVVLAVAGGAWLGPGVLQLVFGEDVVVGSLPTAVVAAGCAAGGGEPAGDGQRTGAVDARARWRGPGCWR